MDQNDLLKDIVEFYNKSRLRKLESDDKKRDTYESKYALYEGRELTFNTFKSVIFPLKATKGEGLKIFTPKQMLQRLAIALAQVKAGNTSKKLLNKIRQIKYSLYRAKEVTKKVYNSIVNSRYTTKMDTIFMNSKNSKTSDLHRLLLNLTDKIDLR